MNNKINKYDFVIFHKGCLDGFSGFFILHKSGKIHKNAIIYPDVPSQKNPPNNIDNKNVIIIDVAYKNDVLREIMLRANHVTFIDHHISIRDDVNKLISSTELKHKNNVIIYDEKKSGASLTWKYFFPNKSVPLFVKYIEDNDIGKWEMKHTLEFITGFEVNFNLDLSKQNIKKWDQLFNKSTVSYLINKGKTYKEYKNYLIDWNYTKYSLMQFPSELIYQEYPQYFNKPGQYKAALYCGSGCPSGTEIGKKILESVNCDFAIMWIYNLDRKEYVLSFRSNNVDVGTIAKIFGGGGHTLAAACSFSKNKYDITDLFFENSLPRSYKK